MLSWLQYWIWGSKDAIILWPHSLQVAPTDTSGSVLTIPLASVLGFLISFLLPWSCPFGNTVLFFISPNWQPASLGSRDWQLGADSCCVLTESVDSQQNEDSLPIQCTHLKWRIQWVFIYEVNWIRKKILFKMHWECHQRNRSVLSALLPLCSLICSSLDTPSSFSLQMPVGICLFHLYLKRDGVNQATAHAGFCKLCSCHMFIVHMVEKRGVAPSLQHESCRVILISSVLDPSHVCSGCN